MDKITAVIPCYNEESALPLFYEAISNIAKEMPHVTFEFLFINDGSTDETLSILQKLSEQNSAVKYISFSRNFGKEAALFAGLQHATGDFVAVLDADMQDPPSLLIEMYRGIKNEPYDIIATRRVTRKGEPVIRSFCARLFYKLINKISKADIVDGARDFRLMTRQVVNALLEMGEYNRFSKGIFGWIGFRTKWVEYENVARVAGETKWSFWKLFIYSLDGVVAFSTVPLYIASIMGFLFCIASFIWIAIIIIKTLIWGDPVAGYPTLACLLLFTSGISLFCMGILGQYLAKTYMEVKHRPIYIIQTANITEKYLEKQI